MWRGAMKLGGASPPAGRAHTCPGSHAAPPAEAAADNASQREQAGANAFSATWLCQSQASPSKPKKVGVPAAQVRSNACSLARTAPCPACNRTSTQHSTGAAVKLALEAAAAAG
eukprot:1626603-Pleurochrysis_carterae.AAC.4